VVKLLDFGLAAVRDLGFEDRNRLTQTGAAVGTLAYMSVEQFLGERVDERADIYSLGVVVFEMLTGELTTKGPTFGRINALLEERLSRMPALSADNDLARVLRKALEEKREDRYGTVMEFRNDLLGALENHVAINVTS
jgi:serine/threonine-protein kinase